MASPIRSPASSKSGSRSGRFGSFVTGSPPGGIADTRLASVVTISSTGRVEQPLAAMLRIANRNGIANRFGRREVLAVLTASIVLRKIETTNEGCGYLLKITPPSL